MSQPAFSICLLAWQSAEHIRTAIESVIVQDYSNWKCIISDDASTDNTGEIIRDYTRDPRIQYFRQPVNLGQAGNWAAAISRCNGQFLATLHADDAYERSALSSFQKGFDTGSDLVWANWEFWDADLKRKIREAPVKDASFQGLDVLRWIVSNAHTLPSATAFQHALARKSGMPDPENGIFCDREFFLRLASNSRSAKALGESVVRYRQHAQSITENSFKTGTFQNDMLRLATTLECKFSRSDNTKTYVRELKRQSAESIVVSAAAELLRGRNSFAWEWFSKAISLSGFSLVRPSLFLGLARMLKARIFSP